MQNLPVSFSGRLAVSPLVAAPALAGIWRPRILLPDTWLHELPRDVFDSVLLHEIGHHRRRDLVWNWFFAFAACLHWMNPLVWLAQRQARRERELACDAWVLARIGEPQLYGGALLEVLARVGAGAPANLGIVAMADRTSHARQRMEWIRRHRRRPRWPALVAWLPAFLLLAAIGTDRLAAEAETSTPAPEKAAPPRSAVASPALPLNERTVEVTCRLLRVPENVRRSLDLPIAEEGSAGIQRVISESERQTLLGTVRADSAAEILPVPRLIARSGQRASFQNIHEFRYPTRFEPSAKTPGLLIPRDIQTTELGMTMEMEAHITSDNAATLNVAPRLVRLLGYVDAAGKTTGNSAGPLESIDRELFGSPAHAAPDWFQRLVASEMPRGTPASAPNFATQTGDANFDLRAEQAALVFGFRDADDADASGKPAKDGPMTNYFLVQVSILP